MKTERGVALRACPDQINQRQAYTYQCTIMAHSAGTENGTLVRVGHSKDYIW